MFADLMEINQRPGPYEHYTADQMWCDPHVSRKMLEYHLSRDLDLASRKHAFIERSSAWITRHFQLGPDQALCDLGCGPGLYTSRLAQSGARVTGVDFSENSIEYAQNSARENGLSIEYVRRNYLEFAPERAYDLVTMIFCDFCALSPMQRGGLLGNIRAMLKPGGALLLDVVSLARFATLTEGRTYSYCAQGGFWAPGAYYEFLNNFKYPDDCLFLSKHTIVEPHRIRRIYNWLQHYSLESLRAELAENGLEVVESYANVAGDPFKAKAPEMAVVARRTAA